jgi:hypothetical protein
MRCAELKSSSLFFYFSQKKIKKTQVDVRSQNAKKFMNMFNKGEIPEGVSSADR